MEPTSVSFAKILARQGISFCRTKRLVQRHAIYIVQHNILQPRYRIGHHVGMSRWLAVFHLQTSQRRRLPPRTDRYPLYTVSQKTVQICFCQNFVKFLPILIIFYRKMAKGLKLCEVHSLFTSPNLTLPSRRMQVFCGVGGMHTARGRSLWLVTRQLKTAQYIHELKIFSPELS